MVEAFVNMVLCSPCSTEGHAAATHPWPQVVSTAHSKFGKTKVLNSTYQCTFLPLHSPLPTPH